MNEPPPFGKHSADPGRNEPIVKTKIVLVLAFDYDCGGINVGDPEKGIQILVILGLMDGLGSAYAGRELDVYNVYNIHNKYT